MSKVLLSSLLHFTVHFWLLGCKKRRALDFSDVFSVHFNTHGESRGQDLFLEGPLGASLCASSLCALLCAHSSSSALARGNGQLLGLVMTCSSWWKTGVSHCFTIFAPRHCDPAYICIQYKHDLVSAIPHSLRLLFWRLRLRLLKSHGHMASKESSSGGGSPDG